MYSEAFWEINYLTLEFQLTLFVMDLINYASFKSNDEFPMVNYQFLYLILMTRLVAGENYFYCFQILFSQF